ncbi:TetR/AcrR family transcriptional regulator [Myxococcaceae bacterium GXIMD 01537]
MPLPRFHRLPAAQQQAILDVARAHFARDGIAGASYNQIIAEAGISKTAAYQYFDGKDDLAATVLEQVRRRVLGLLGKWEPAPSAEVFWSRLRESGARLVEHLASSPEDLALISATPESGPRAESLRWFEDVLDDGIGLGVIRGDVDRALLLSVTSAFFQAADGWALGVMRGRGLPSMEQAWSLLEGLWAPRGTRKRGR